jgi:tungstate transport system substrate-binding protein
MFNDFVIVGPLDDPAGIAGAGSATEAFAQLLAAGQAGDAVFVSRGDDSGTHSRELSVWAEAELMPEGDWYISAGQGMGAVLNMSNELAAYTLTDRATYAARLVEGLDLAVLVEGDPLLLNPYGVLAVNPSRFDGVNTEGAAAFVDWLTDVETQAMIGEFAVNDTVLFTPSSARWLAAQVTPTAIPTVTATATARP